MFQNLPRLGEYLQEPLLTATPVLHLLGDFFTCHLLAVKAALEPEDGGQGEH